MDATNFDHEALNAFCSEIAKQLEEKGSVSFPVGEFQGNIEQHTDGWFCWYDDDYEEFGWLCSGSAFDAVEWVYRGDESVQETMREKQ